MTATLDDATRTILGAVLQSAGGEALYPDARDRMGLDIGGDEFAVNPYRQRRLPPITDADIVAHLTQGPQQPRPAITAWRGADMDAYWLDGQTWRHCRSGEIWKWKP